MSKDPSEHGNDASNANNFHDLFRSEVNPRTGKLKISIAAPKLPGMGGLDVDLGIDYVQGAGMLPKRVLGLPARWHYRLSYIVGGQININGQQSYPVDTRWTQGMKYYSLKDMRLERHDHQPALPHDEQQHYLHVLTLLNGEKQYFDVHGRLIETADPQGNHILYYYNSPDADVQHNTLKRIVDTHGQIITFDHQTRVVQITLPGVKQKEPRIRYEFDAAGQLITYQDPAERKTTFAYGGGKKQRNLLSRIESPNKLVTTLAYELIHSKRSKGEVWIDVVSKLIRTFQDTVRTTRFNLNPSGNKHNYTGYPNHSLDGHDSLLESGDQRYHYTTTVDDGITLTRHTYNGLHLELRTDVHSSSKPKDLISSTLYTYPSEGSGETFPAFKKLSVQYQRPKQVEIRNYNPDNPQKFRSTKRVRAYNDAGQLTSTEEFVASDGVTFQKERAESTRYDSRFGQVTEKDTTDHRATGEYSKTPVITRLARTLAADGSLVASSQVGFVTAGTFSPSLTTTYTYDDKGRVTQQEYAWVDPEKKLPGRSVSQTTYAYDKDLHQLTLKNTELAEEASAEPSTNKFLGAFKKGVTSTTKALGITGKDEKAGVSTSQVIDIVTSCVLSETDALGATTRFTYDALGRKTSCVDPLKQTTRWDYDDATQTTTVTNPNGYQSFLQNDGLGQLISNADNAGPDGKKRVLYNRAYDAQGRLIQEVGVLGKGTTLTYAYDSRGRLSELTDGEGNVRSYTYDEVDNSQSESFNGILKRTRWFDDRQEIVKEESFDSTSNTKSHGTSTGHDVHGKVASTRLEDSTAATVLTRRITRDILGNELKTETRAKDGTTVIRLEDRDLFGNVTLTTKTLQLDAGKSATSAVSSTHLYDSLGRLIKTTTPLGKSETFTYDANGNLVTWTDLAGTTFTHTYDAVGGLIRREFTEGKVKHTFEYTYEAATRRLLCLEHFADKASVNRIEYTYSKDGTLSSTRYQPDDKQLKWEYSAETQQLLHFTDAANVKTSFTYTSSGMIQKAERASGDSRPLTFSYYSKKESAAHSGKLKTLASGKELALTYTYDGLGRIGTVTAMAPALAGSKALLVITYAYDTTTGNITGKHFSSEHAPQEVALNHQLSYQYNGIGQLIQEEDLDSTGQLLTRRAYVYDAAGNVLKRTLARTGAKEETATFTYDADNKLVSLRIQGGSEQKLTYDLLGNLTDDGAGRKYSYNALGQLTGYVDSAATKFSYAYQPDGLRESKRRADETPVRFLYDQEQAPNIVNEFQGTKSVSHQQVGGARCTRTVQGEGTEAFIHDQSSVAASVLGQAVSARRYSAYGELDSPPEGATSGGFNLKDNPFGFAGEYRDVESGLSYHRARYYDPRLMRFLTRDRAPLFNRYSYASGNPVMLSDPSGNASIWQWLTLIVALVVTVAVTVLTAGALSALSAGLLVGASTLVQGAATMGIAIVSSTVGTLVGSGINAIGASCEDGQWGADRYFNKDLGISLAVGVVAPFAGTAVTRCGLRIARHLAGETGRRAFAGKCLAGMIGGTSEATLNGTTSQLISKGRVDWDESLFASIATGGFGGAAGEFADTILNRLTKCFAKKSRPPSLRDAPPEALRMRPFRNLDDRLDVPMVALDRGPPGYTGPREAWVHTAEVPGSGAAVSGGPSSITYTLVEPFS